MLHILLRKGVKFMATSTFNKQFAVKKNKAIDFVKEMSKPATPTLKKGFQTQLTHEKDLREQLAKVLK